MRRAREHHLAVERTARYWTLGGGDDESPDEIWFVLHGYKQLARRFLRRFEAVASSHRLVVAPEGLSRFYVSSGGGRHGAESVVGASWMTREDRLAEISDYVGYLDRLAAHVGVEGDASSGGSGTLSGDAPSRGPGASAGDGPEVTVLGFSQGVATASRWATQGSVRPRRLVLWGDFLPPDLDLERAERALEGVDLVLVRGSDDRALSSPELAAEEARRLAATGLRPRTLSYEGGHDIDEETLRGLVSEG